MKSLLLNSVDLNGGAAIASYRLHKGLNSIGIQSTMLVQNKISDDTSVLGHVSKLAKALGKIRPYLDILPLMLYKSRGNTPWSVGWFPNAVSKKINQIAPDIVHLNWICKGFIPINDLPRIKRPIVWTLHDMWAFTGGCHYADICLKYQSYCRACPQLSSNSDFDLSRWVWNRKNNYWKNINLTIITPSKWLAECARNSSLFNKRRIEVIPNGIDTELFRPLNKKFCREVLNLPQDKKLILFGAMGATSDKRKGFQYLQLTLQKLAAMGWREQAELIVFGSSEPSNPPDMTLKTRYVGRDHDEITLAMFYSASDAFVAPSVMENLPNTVMESLACGTPCIAFDIGGMPDLIEHLRNGYLAEPFNPDDFACGIDFVLSDVSRWHKLSQCARDKVLQEFEIKRIAQRYAALYQELID